MQCAECVVQRACMCHTMQCNAWCVCATLFMLAPAGLCQPHRCGLRRCCRRVRVRPRAPDRRGVRHSRTLRMHTGAWGGPHVGQVHDAQLADGFLEHMQRSRRLNRGPSQTHTRATPHTRPPLLPLCPTPPRPLASSPRRRLPLPIKTICCASKSFNAFAARQCPAAARSCSRQGQQGNQ